MKNIAILTSGGDCSGMNAVIYYAARYAKNNNVKLYGVIDGYKGLVNNKIELLNTNDLKKIKFNGGTILGTARLKEFANSDVQDKAVVNLKSKDIDTLIVLGGDGSFKGGRALSRKGIKVYGIPCTIDNDIFYTDYTIGFYSCVNVIEFCANCIRDTMNSHRRVGIIEVMGRECGDIALYSGIKTNSELILIPEVKTSIDTIKQTLINNRNNGKNGQIIMLGEGVSSAKELRNLLESEMPDFEFRDTCIGHIQRGGKTTVEDETLAHRFVDEIFKLLKKDIYNKAIGIRDDKIINCDFEDIYSFNSHPKNENLYNTYIKK